MCFSTTVHAQIFEGPVEDLNTPQPALKKDGQLFKPETSCSRFFIYRNRAYPMDSSRKQDGEGLRFLLKKQPQSEALLNEYQNTLKYSRWPAYFGSLGLLIAIGGSIASVYLVQPPKDQKPARMISIASGITLLLASYAYGQHIIYMNEKRLQEALTTYNAQIDAKDRIQLNSFQTYLDAPQWPLYTGLFGISVMLGGLAYSSTIENYSRATMARNIGLAGGALITVSSFAYRQYIKSNYEKPLEKTAQNDHDAAEDDGVHYTLFPTPEARGAGIAAEFRF